MPTSRRRSRKRISAIEDVAAVDDDLARRMLVRIEFVDAVDRAQQGRLAAARRTDDRGHRIRRNAQVDGVERVALAVEEIEIRGSSIAPGPVTLVAIVSSGSAGIDPER